MQTGMCLTIRLIDFNAISISQGLFYELRELHFAA